MRILITGGSGFVGSALSLRLLENGHEVIALGASSEKGLPDHPHFRYVKADTSAPGEWQKEVGQVHAVLNLAGRNIFNY